MGNRIFVVRTYCGEAEFDRSVESVTAQINVNVDDYVCFNYIPDLEAHNKIVDMFSENTQKYDMFVKIDADTIITKNTAFVDVLNFFQSNDYAAVQLFLHDYFTEKNISGLNFYHPTRNSFVRSENRLFTDRAIVHHGKVAYSEQFPHLTPVGYHCLFPNDSQAFHYGYHRGLKNQTQHEVDLRVAFAKHNDRARDLALMGFHASRINKGDHEYTAINFQQLLNDAITKVDEKRK